MPNRHRRLSGVEIKKRMFLLRGRKGRAYFRLAELHSTLKASCFIVHGCTDSVVEDGTIVGLDRAVPTSVRQISSVSKLGCHLWKWFSEGASCTDQR